MGDISIIARRRQDHTVQYGWSGNGGYFSEVGRRLLQHYNSPEMTEYLFGLGQMIHIGLPYSEKIPRGFMNTHAQTGEPHYVGTTENEIFSKIRFIDYGYFYDLDEHWYYVMPGPFFIKVPLELISNNLNENGYEFDFRRQIECELLQYIFKNYLDEDKEFAELVKSAGLDEAALKVLLEEDFPVYQFYEKYGEAYSYFDRWVVALGDEENCNVQRFKLRKMMGEHVETNEW